MFGSPSVCLYVCLACIHTIPAVSGLGVWVCWQRAVGRVSNAVRTGRVCYLLSWLRFLCTGPPVLWQHSLLLFVSLLWAWGAGAGGFLASLMLQLYSTMLAGRSCWLCSWASTALSICSPLLLVRRGVQLAHQSFGLTPILAAPSYCGGATHVLILFHASCWPRGCSGRLMALTFKGLTLGALTVVRGLAAAASGALRACSAAAP